MSILGMALQLAGLSAVLYGVYAVYPPLAFVMGGVVALVIGERL